jgi:hypothetical protein
MGRRAYSGADAGKNHDIAGATSKGSSSRLDVAVKGLSGFLGKMRGEYRLSPARRKGAA